jgi:hypothetical protein
MPPVAIPSRIEGHSLRVKVANRFEPASSAIYIVKKYSREALKPAAQDAAIWSALTL